MKTTRRVVVDEPALRVEIAPPLDRSLAKIPPASGTVAKQPESVENLRAALQSFGRRRLFAFSAATFAIAVVTGTVGLTSGVWLPILLAGSGFLSVTSLSLGVWAGAKPAPREAEEDQTVVKTRSVRIAALMSTEKSPLTVETIQAKLGWTEEAVVSGIRRLLEDGQVVEDLDLDDGHWCYRLATADDRADQVPRAQLAIEDRADAVREHLDTRRE